MSSDSHLGRAYPFLYEPGTNRPPDCGIADIDITVYSEDFDPTSDRFTAVTIDAVKVVLACSNLSIPTITISLGDNSWSEIEIPSCRVRILAGPKSCRQVGWSGVAVIEPTRVVKISGVRQTVEVYNRKRDHLQPKPGCQEYPFDDTWLSGEFVLLCGPLDGDVALSGGHSTRVAQYDSQETLQVRGDRLGGELGKPCSGQTAYDTEELPPPGRETLDGASRCIDVLKSINGISRDSFRFSGGNGINIFQQPEKSRVTIRFDGSGMAICPDLEILPAPCPNTPEPPCGGLCHWEAEYRGGSVDGDGYGYGGYGQGYEYWEWVNTEYGCGEGCDCLEPAFAPGPENPVTTTPCVAPPGELPSHCGPLIDIDLCPDDPDTLSVIKRPGTIPAIDKLVQVGPSQYEVLPESLRHLARRSCQPAEAIHDGTQWIYKTRCLPHCRGDLPTRIGVLGERTPVTCRSEPADPTIGFRNNDFEMLDFWSYNQPPIQLTAHPSFTAAQLPALGLSPGQTAYQTEISVPHRSILKFDYLGSIRLVIASLGRLVLDIELSSPTNIATYIGEIVIPAGQAIAVQFESAGDSSMSVVSMPHLAKV